MNNRRIAIVQVALNSILLILVSAVYFCVPLAMAGFFAVSGPDNEPLASWWLRVAQQIVESPPDRIGLMIVVAAFSLANVIFVVWLSRKYTQERYLSLVPMWVNLVCGIIPGIIARFAWRGIRNAQEVNAAKVQVSVNKQWISISKVSGCVAATGICFLFVLCFLPSGGALDTLFVDVLLGSCAASLLLFCGFNHAVRIRPAAPITIPESSPKPPAL